MLYFEPFMGNHGYSLQIPPYSYKSWAIQMFGEGTTPGWSDAISVKENIEGMIGGLKIILKNISKTLTLIWDVMSINNLAFEKPIYTINIPSGQWYTGFEPWLKFDSVSNTYTLFLTWSRDNLPTVASVNGVDVGNVVTYMTLTQGADYLLKIHTEMAMTISELTIMKNFY